MFLTPYTQTLLCVLFSMFAMVEENGEIEMNRLVTKRRIIWKLIANGVKISSHGLGFYTLLHFLIKADDRDLNDNLIPNSAISDGKSNFSFDFFVVVSLFAYIIFGFPFLTRALEVFRKSILYLKELHQRRVSS